MKVGMMVFFPSLVQDTEIKTEKLVIYDAEVISVIDENTVELRVNVNGNFQTTISDVQMITETRHEAEDRIINYVRLREIRQFREQRKTNPNYLPEEVSFAEGIFSGNPLRYGEPGVIFGAQTNTFGSTESTQKIFQLIGSVIEDTVPTKAGNLECNGKNYP